MLFQEDEEEEVGNKQVLLMVLIFSTRKAYETCCRFLNCTNVHSPTSDQDDVEQAGRGEASKDGGLDNVAKARNAIACPWGGILFIMWSTFVHSPI